MEKLRHSEPLFAPKKVVFHWDYGVTPNGDEKIMYRVMLEPSDADVLSLRENFTDKDFFWIKATESIISDSRNNKNENVEYDLENQRIIITDSKKEKKFTLNLKGSGIRLVKDDSEL